MKKHHSNAWFTKVRGSYLPCSWQGWLLYIPYAGYILGIVAYVTAHGYDRWLSIFLVVPNWVAALAVMTWIAKARS